MKLHFHDRVFQLYHPGLLFSILQVKNIRTSKQKWLVQRERRNHIYLSREFTEVKISATCDSKHWNIYVGFCRFLSEIKVLEVLSQWDDEEDWTIPHEAVETFGWTFSDSFMFPQVHLYWLLAKGHVHFWNHQFTLEEHWGEEINVQFKKSKVEWSITKQNCVVKYHTGVQSKLPESAFLWAWEMPLHMSTRAHETVLWLPWNTQEQHSHHIEL